MFFAHVKHLYKDKNILTPCSILEVSILEKIHWGLRLNLLLDPGKLAGVRKVPSAMFGAPETKNLKS